MSVKAGKFEYLYVAGFSNGTVKVGRSRRPATRRIEHDRSARGFGITLEEWAQFKVDGCAIKAEKALLANARKYAKTVFMGEWLGGAAFKDVMGCASSIAYAYHEPDKTRELIMLAGGPSKVAREIGISRDTVRDWESIPTRHANTINMLAALKQHRSKG